MTRVVAFNGSPRKEGNTSILIEHILAELDNEGIEIETIHLGGKKIHGCTACGKCFENRDRRCVIDDDMVNACIEKICSADGIILGSPVYFLDVTPEMKALIDRAGFVSFANGHIFKNKVGNAAVALRRTGASRTADSMIHFFLANEMIVSSLPVIGIGREIGEILHDEEGLARAKSLGQAMAQLLNHLNLYPLPEHNPTQVDYRITKKRKQE